MEHKTIQLIGLEFHEFQTMISNIVDLLIQKNLKLYFDPSPKDDDVYLTRKEAAAFLKLSETTLYNLDKSQELPAVRIGGRVLYRKSDLLDLAET